MDIPNSSQDEKEENQDEELNDDNDPKVAVIRCLQQMLHFCISINHIAFSTVYVVAQLGDSGILTRDLFTKVLRLILSRLDNSNHFVKLIVRIGDLFLLELKDLAVIELSGLFKLTIFSATEIFLILCSQRSLCVV